MGYFQLVLKIVWSYSKANPEKKPGQKNRKETWLKDKTFMASLKVKTIVGIW